MGKYTLLAESFLIIFGIFLILDSFVLHLITFNYESIGLGFLDPYLQHWMWGILFFVVGVIGIKKD